MNYSIYLDNFEGPMDLLLHLVKEAKMDIYDINISLIIEQYLNIINETKNLNIDIASEYLVMASNLIYLKSKKLINEHDEESNLEEEINSVEELKDKLIMYEKFQNVTKEFNNLIEIRSDIFERDPDNLKDYLDEEIIVNKNLNLQALIDAVKEYQNRIEYKKPKNTKITKKEISVVERINKIRNILKERQKVLFTELFEDTSIPYIVVTFLSVLSMCNNNEIVINQNNNFGEIYLESRTL